MSYGYPNRRNSRAESREEYDRSVATFKRFDHNGDGIISRDELSYVFSAMDPDHWDDDRLNQLMDVVDINGDGQIKYEEFVQWLMGDDHEWELDRYAAELKGEKDFAKNRLVMDSRKSEGRTDPISFQVDQSSGGKIGIKVDGSDGRTLLIKDIKTGGLLAAYNEQNTVRHVGVGDRVVDVNGVVGDSRKLMKELTKKLPLDVVVQPRVAATGYSSKISDAYKVERNFIEDGNFSCIRKCRNIKTNRKFAVKSVHKTKVDRSSFEDMTSLLSSLDHPNIVKMFDVFEDCLDFHVVLEYCAGGQVLERVLSDTCFTERQAIRMMTQILQGVTYLHANNVCHRDLRPEHVLLLEDRPINESYSKIIDFHAARRFEEGTRFQTQVGLPLYMAPEVVRRNGYNQAVDIWACGVIMFLAISGYPPFAGETDRETLTMVKNRGLCFPDDWTNVSADAKDLIENMLMKQPDTRIAAAATLFHPWIVEKETRIIDYRLHQGQDRMHQFVGTNRLKKAALHAVALRLKDDDIRRLQDMFALLDKNGDKTVTFFELKDGLDKLGKSESLGDLKKIMEEIDVDGSRRIDYTEFVAATLDRRQHLENDTCWGAFQVFDRDRSGYINREELAQVLVDKDVQEVMGMQAVNRVMEDCDHDRDGQISFDEFMIMMRRDNESCQDF